MTSWQVTANMESGATMLLSVRAQTEEEMRAVLMGRFLRMPERPQSFEVTELESAHDRQRRASTRYADA